MNRSITLAIHGMTPETTSTATSKPSTTSRSRIVISKSSFQSEDGHTRRPYRFVETSVKILEDYGLDGLDIDYEYPQNDEQAKGYVELLKELRYGLDIHQKSKGIDYKFLLTVCLFSSIITRLLTLTDRSQRRVDPKITRNFM
jgi:hypothetical protein